MIKKQITEIWDQVRGRTRITEEVRQLIRDALRREEEDGARTLLYFRYVILACLVIGGVASAPNRGDMLANLVFASAYLLVLIAQHTLLARGMHRALHTFNYVSLVADHAIFAGLLIFYYRQTGGGNFNHALKSPYFVLLLIPTATTLVQFRYRLLLFSAATFFCVIVALLVYALYSDVPQSDSWHQYVLGESIILVAWAGLWILMVLLLVSIVGYGIFRSVRMVSQIGLAEAQKTQLSRYFSPAIVDEIAASGAQIRKGVRQHVAVLFADVRSFTALSESLSPDELADMLASLRRLQIHCVFTHNGSVDKFIGDAIMAVFGTPRPAASPEVDIQNAVKAGLAMHAALRRWNLERTQAGMREIHIGIGVHAGIAFAGNLGDEDHLEYTVIGDTVNTASRLEQQCKALQRDFIISETVAAALTPDIATEKLGTVEIRGKSQPMQLFAVLH